LSAFEKCGAVICSAVDVVDSLGKAGGAAENGSSLQHRSNGKAASHFSSTPMSPVGKYKLITLIQLDFLIYFRVYS
jgi:hypothetical protein